ncbi:hypothetical protein [Herbaspirillum huttiense]|uniref:Uncharacterized protein n=1 Tax=Herbaspirillum huttiense subsp. lycopersici TaxID=3074428 RepID=A0ABU2EGU0_9BURK|nr:hypothetical protein [Herbaspirillum huttiense]MDR9846997.1 hypothetical protein [Herbaspirillum huttiense SE1]
MNIKNPRVLLDTHSVRSGPAYQSSEALLKFVAKLGVGTSASVMVEMSADGVNNWLEVGTFTLDTAGEEVDTDLLRVPLPYVRARVLSIAGNTPRITIYMGS